MASEFSRSTVAYVYLDDELSKGVVITVWHAVEGADASAALRIGGE